MSNKRESTSQDEDKAEGHEFVCTPNEQNVSSPHQLFSTEGGLSATDDSPTECQELVESQAEITALPSLILPGNTSVSSPPEVWEKIFRKLPAKDLVALINSSEIWRALMQSERTSAFLPMVMPTLVDKVNIPNNAQLLSTVLSWRQLSRNGKLGIDSIISRWSTSSIAYFEHQNLPELWNGNSYRLTGNLNKNLIGNSEQVQSLLNHFLYDDDSKANPFLTRHIYLRVNQNFLYDESLHSMLTSYGKHLFCLTICPEKLSRNSLIRLLELLELIPNLMLLRITGVMELDWEEDVLPIEPQHFPKLDKLELLDLAGIEPAKGRLSLGSLFFEQYGSQIQTLCCTRFLIENMSMDTLNSQLPNIRRLRVGPISSSLLQAMVGLEWPLENIQFRRYAWLQYPTLTDLLKVFNKFAPTLTGIQLRVDQQDGTPEQFNSFDNVKEITRDLERQILDKVTTLTLTPFVIGMEWLRRVIAEKCPNLMKIELSTKLTGEQMRRLRAVFQRAPKRNIIRIRYFCPTAKCYMNDFLFKNENQL